MDLTVDKLREILEKCHGVVAGDALVFVDGHPVEYVDFDDEGLWLCTEHPCKDGWPYSELEEVSV